MDNLENRINRAVSWLQSGGESDYIGESVSQLEHALQCAYFAKQAGHSKEVILASLLHDIGHFASSTQQFDMANLGVVNHEWIGAKLAYDLGFSAKVALLIGYHVDAKRYLAGKKNNYFERLSKASRATLTFQGGVMSAEEIQHFENHCYFKEILQVRINDEKAKEIGLKVYELNYYRPYLQEHFNENSSHHAPDLELTDYVDKSWVDKLKFGLEKRANHEIASSLT